MIETPKFPAGQPVNEFEASLGGYRAVAPETGQDGTTTIQEMVNTRLAPYRVHIDMDNPERVEYHTLKGRGENGGDLEVRVYTFGPVDDPRIVPMSVRRSDGNVEAGWQAVGVAVMGGNDSKQAYYCLEKLEEIPGRKPRPITKFVPMDIQEVLMSELAAERAAASITVNQVAESMPAPNERERKVNELLQSLGIPEKYHSVVQAFAFAAANKRSAQKDGLTDEANYYSQRMGAALKELPRGLHQAAVVYATGLFGDGNVAL